MSTADWNETVLSSLPLLPGGERLVGTDSHDVTGGNNDGFLGTYSYLYEDERGRILFDRKGPGCVLMVRTIGFSGNMKVFVDDAEIPAIDIPFDEMHSGEHPDFPSHLVCDEDRGHGSAWCFVPIPYRTRCIILAADDTAEHPYRFYNISAYSCATVEQAEQIAADVTERLDAVQWTHPEDMCVFDMYTAAENGSVDVSAQGTAVLLDTESAGSVKWFRLRLPSYDAETLESLRLRAFWDGDRSPAVDVPVGMFFAVGMPIDGIASYEVGHGKCMNTVLTGTTRPCGVPVGQSEDGSLYCNFPMPFWKAARIELMNTSNEPICDVAWALGLSSQTYPETAGYFTAYYRREDGLLPYRDHTLLDVRGYGKYIGCVLRASSRELPYNSTEVLRHYLEGDARFYIDDAKAFVCGSTGTEEYFLWGWYDVPPKEGVFAFPTHGYTEHTRSLQDHSTMYRFHVSDPIPYYRAFRFDLEHGGEGEVPADYRSVAFCYHRPEPLLVLSDGVEASEGVTFSGAAVENGGIVWEGARTLVYEGNEQVRKAGDGWTEFAGVRLSGNSVDGECSFTVQLVPENAGVLVRRVFNGAWPDMDWQPETPEVSHVLPAQEAAVTVDGQDAGLWYRPSSHARHCWMEDEFEISARHTRGKEKITVSLRSTGAAAWNAFRYFVFSRIEPGPKGE